VLNPKFSFFGAKSVLEKKTLPNDAACVSLDAIQAGGTLIERLIKQL